MSTRAAQIELLAGPLIDPLTGSLCSGYTVYFYAAGTSNAKNVWTEKEKTNPFTSYLLDSGGKALLYGDGIYKIVVKNPDGTTVLTLDNQKIQATTYSSVQKIANYTATPDDDVILCSGTWTLSLQTVANFEHPLFVKNIGAGTITVDPYLSETIDAAASYSLGPGDALSLIPDTTSTVWRLATAIYDLNGLELILDADGDTKMGAPVDDVFQVTLGGLYEISTPINHLDTYMRFLTGDPSTATWFHNNTAPPGWKVIVYASDYVLGCGGGTYATGGATAGQWTVSGLSSGNEFSHTHAVPSHNHKWYDCIDGDDDLSYDAAGQGVAIDDGTYDTYNGLAVLAGSSYRTIGKDAYTANAGDTNTGAGSAHNHTVSHDGLWRIQAVTGKICQLDLA